MAVPDQCYACLCYFSTLLIFLLMFLDPHIGPASVGSWPCLWLAVRKFHSSLRKVHLQPLKRNSQASCCLTLAEGGRFLVFPSAQPAMQTHPEMRLMTGWDFSTHWHMFGPRTYVNLRYVIKDARFKVGSFLSFPSCLHEWIRFLFRLPHQWLRRSHRPLQLVQFRPAGSCVEHICMKYIEILKYNSVDAMTCEFINVREAVVSCTFRKFVSDWRCLRPGWHSLHVFPYQFRQSRRWNFLEASHQFMATCNTHAWSHHGVAESPSNVVTTHWVTCVKCDTGKPQTPPDVTGLCTEATHLLAIFG